MTNFLETILARKREEVELRKKAVSLDRLKARPAYSRSVKSLRRALEGKHPAVIAEIKKASPSKGVLREKFDHRTIARQYIEGGASALSILTDKKYFQGDLAFLDDIAPLATIPILRKDFIIDPYQLFESRAHGADAVLLIAAALNRDLLRELYLRAEELGLECLVEVHSHEDLSVLDGTPVGLVGINNRDLGSFEVDLGTTARLAPAIPPQALIVSESGITTSDDVKKLAEQNVHAVLVGEFFMKSPDPGMALRDLLRKTGTP